MQPGFDQIKAISGALADLFEVTVRRFAGVRLHTAVARASWPGRHAQHLLGTPFADTQCALMQRIALNAWALYTDRQSHRHRWIVMSDVERVASADDLLMNF